MGREWSSVSLLETESKKGGKIQIKHNLKNLKLERYKGL